MAGKETPRIAIVVGGPSAEAEVSRVSGRGVADSLRENYEHVTEIVSAITWV